jgi:NDP-sugar pyrophosphorylase family protein
MAGSNDLFKKEGYGFPKPLIEIGNKPIVQHVVESLSPILDNNCNIIFVVRQGDFDKYYLDKTIKLIIPQAKVVPVLEGNSGAAVTALLAIEEVNQDESLLIINGDQVIDTNPVEMLNKIKGKGADAGVVVFESVHPRWSYVKCSESGYVIEAAEKKPISNLATAGFYFYNKASYYFDAAKRMIIKDSHVGGIFYVCPVFNEMLLSCKKIVTVKIHQNKYHSFMSPKMVSVYEQYLLEKR